MNFIYAVTTFANQSGKVMSMARRGGAGSTRDALIIMDDVYDMLQRSSSPESEPRYPDKSRLASSR